MAELEPQFLETVDISGLELRSALTGLQEGVLGAGDLKVTAGAVGRSVDVAAGIAFIQGDTVVDQGLYRARNDAAKNSDAFDLGGITPNGTGNGRIDCIVARIYDQTHDGSGLRKWRLEVVPGVAAAGVTLDNRNGAPGGPGGPAFPASAELLADVLVPAGAVSILAGNVRDRRTRARGARRVIVRNLNGSGVAGEYQTTSTTSLAIDATNLSPRIECSGVPLKVHVAGSFGLAAAGALGLILGVDGAALAGTQRLLNSVAGGDWRDGPKWDGVVPAAGSHLIAPRWFLASGGTNTRALVDANNSLVLAIEEDLRPNADNT